MVRHGTHEVVIARRVPLPSMVDLGDTTLAPAEVRTVILPRTSGSEVVVQMEPVRLLDVAEASPVVPIASVPLGEGGG